MDGYPDPEDEFEMMYAADMEAMDAMGDDDGPDDFDLGPGASKRAKKSLSFVNKQTKPSAPAEVEEEAETLLDSSITGIDDQSATPVQVAPEPSLQQTIQEEINQTYSSRKRKANTTAEDLFGDIEDIEVEDFYTSAFGNINSSYFFLLFNSYGSPTFLYRATSSFGALFTNFYHLYFLQVLLTRKKKEKILS